MHDILYQGIWIAFESSAPHTSKNDMLVVDYDANILARSPNPAYGITKPFTQVACDIVSAHRTSCVGQARR